MTRASRLAVELVIVAIAVTTVVTGVLYAVGSPSFDDPARGENAWRNFVNVARFLAVLGTAAGWVVWLTWRRRARLDAQPDGPARLLALGVAILPDARRDWGAAMTAELASLADRPARWRFATSGARAALAPSAGASRPAAGWAAGALGLVGVMACVATAVHMMGTDAGASDVTPAYAVVALVIVLAVCLVVIVAAPPALMSSALARRAGVGLGVMAGVGLLVVSRAGGLESGAMELIVPVQLLAFVAVPAAVAAVARSLGAALQCIVWGFVFSSVTMFPVYLVESIRRYRTGGGLYLDGDAPPGSSVGSNLTDAVAWLLLVVPSVLVPVGILVAALAASVARFASAVR